jgi:hypothetical protein
MASNNVNKTTVFTRDSSTIAVKKGGTLLPVFTVGQQVFASAGGNTIKFEVGYSNPYQLCAKRGSEGAKALHTLLSTAIRKDGLVEVTVWAE